MTTAHESLLDLLVPRLDEFDLDEETTEVILSVCAEEGTPAAAEAPSTAPSGVFLRGVTVTGFRGVGPEATISFTPGPGLTLVVGRNGSGKSSFAEALELLLTGDSRRWARRSAIWKEGWQNLHHAEGTSIRADFDVEGAATPLSIQRQWAPSAPLDEGSATAQFRGEKQMPLDDLGWRVSIETFRPFLSYNELGSILDEGPSKLFDALSSVLGLDEIVEVTDRLSVERKRLESIDKELRAQAKAIASEASALADERAVQAAQQFTKRSPDLDALEKLVRADFGSEPAAGEVATLRSLAALTPPDPEEAGQAAGRLRAAARAAGEVVGTDAAQARELAGLLEGALRHHDRHGSDECPVCGTSGVLDDTWRTRAEAEVAVLRDRAAGADQAARNADAELASASRLLQPVPPALERAGDVGLDASSAREVWKAFANWRRPESEALIALADHLEAHVWPLATAVSELSLEVSAALAKREDEWRPVAQQLDAWLLSAGEHVGVGARAKRFKSAEAWMKSVASDVRNERFAPIAGAAVAYWRLLRQQSNVELGRVVLEGAATRRKVVLDVTVDGVSGAALGVMSQGELHALALSLFLPRATLAQSPFRFLVLDDPVQSMDPARVDGLARVLHESARDRQVVVFTHDDRLPDSIRRLGLPARVLEVTRRPGSVVEIRAAVDPVKRSLEDAHALVRAELPEETVRRVVPGLCRIAIEAQCAEIVWRRRLASGARHEDIEAALRDADRLVTMTALALFDDERSTNRTSVGRRYLAGGVVQGGSSLWKGIGAGRARR